MRCSTKKNGRMIIVSICLLIAILISGCGENAPELSRESSVAKEEDTITETEEVNSTKSQIEEPVLAETPEQQVPIVCINTDYLRIRNAPNGDILTQTVDGKEYTIYAKRRGYVYTDTVEKDGYKWYCIGENQWIGTKPDWVVESYLGENFDLDTDSRIPFEITGGYVPNLVSRHVDEISSYLELDDVQKDLLVFLNYTIPGLEFTGVRMSNLDMDNLSDEDISTILEHLFMRGPVMPLDAKHYPELLTKTAQLYLDNSTIERESDPWVIDDNEYYTLEGVLWAPMYLEEHLNYISRTYYGEVIDFRTCDYVDFYDPENKIIVPIMPFITGVGGVDTLPYVYEYRIDDNMIIAKIAVAYVCDSDNGYSPGVIFRGSEGIEATKENIIQYAEQKAEVAIRISEDGQYQLRTVKIIND